MNLSIEQRQAHWNMLLLPMAIKPGDPVEDSERSKEKKQTRMYGRKSSHGNCCYLSLEQIERMMVSIINHPGLGEKRGGRKAVYDDLLNEGVITDDHGMIMTTSTFGQYYATALTKKNIGNAEAIARHCLKYRLSTEVTAVIAGIKRQEAFFLIRKIKKELSE